MSRIIFFMRKDYACLIAYPVLPYVAILHCATYGAIFPFHLHTPARETRSAAPSLRPQNFLIPNFTLPTLKPLEIQATTSRKSSKNRSYSHCGD